MVWRFDIAARVSGRKFFGCKGVLQLENGSTALKTYTTRPDELLWCAPMGGGGVWGVYGVEHLAYDRMESVVCMNGKFT